MPKENLKLKTNWSIIKKDRNGNILEEVDLGPNLLLDAGVTVLLNRLSGLGGTAYGATAKIGVGNGSTPASAGQTTLQGGSTLFKTVNAAPVVAGNRITWLADFGPGEAEFIWLEMCVRNTDNVLLNRAVYSGTSPDGFSNKASSPGVTWTARFYVELD